MCIFALNVITIRNLFLLACNLVSADFEEKDPGLFI